MAVPGCPLPAACGASIRSPRMTLTPSCSMSDVVMAPTLGGGGSLCGCQQRQGHDGFGPLVETTMGADRSEGLPRQFRPYEAIAELPGLNLDRLDVAGD